MIKTFLKRFYIILILIYLYAPILTLIVLSFNKSKSRSKWGGFTFHWYIELFKDDEIMQALLNTLLLAVLSSLIATIIGTIAALAMNNMKRSFRSIFMGITNIPMLNAEIVTGISLMLLFITFNLKFGFMTILLAHITFNIPYVILSVMPRLKQLNPSTYEAAMDLGAPPLKAFFKVVFPDIAPGIFSGILMAFTMSIDDFIITYFTQGAGVDTLSTKIYAMGKRGIQPEIYSLSTIIFISVLILLVLINLLDAKNDNPKKKNIKTKTQEVLK